MSNKKETPKNWEIKDRHYFLSGRKTPLTLTIPSKHTRKHPLLYFDPILNSQREIRFATNQQSCFVDEQKGEATMGHITFTDGVLMVKKELQTLQKLLSIYHPLSGRLFMEHDNIAVAEDELYNIELEIHALNAAQQMDIDQAEAILRVELGSQVGKMASKEIKRDLLMFAKRNPKLFIDLANDENVILRNFAIKAVELGIITLSPDQRTFLWATNKKKLVTVPFDQNPYSEFAAFLKTDEGLEVYKSIEKKLK
tara:strand:+ start:540 stop:1301 length:762 start_codon:yes stop_codon:yes gene_type:complete